MFDVIFSQHCGLSRNTGDMMIHRCRASSVGVLPGMAFFIYLGSLAQNLASLASSDSAPQLDSRTTVATAVLSGVMITVVALVTGAYAKRAINLKLGDRGTAPEDRALLPGGQRSEQQVTPAVQRHGALVSRSLPV